MKSHGSETNDTWQIMRIRYTMQFVILLQVVSSHWVRDIKQYSICSADFDWLHVDFVSVVI